MGSMWHMGARWKDFGEVGAGGAGAGHQNLVMLQQRGCALAVLLAGRVLVLFKARSPKAPSCRYPCPCRIWRGQGGKPPCAEPSAPTSMETPAARSAPVAGGDRGTELDTAPKLFPLPGPGCSVPAVRGESPPWGRGGAELRGLPGGDLPKVLPSRKIIHWASLSDDGSSGCSSCIYYSAARFDAYHPEG